MRFVTTLAFSIATLALVAGSVSAQNKYVVNSTDDDPDVGAGGTCDTGQVQTEGFTKCTLRAAIEEANRDALEDTIAFDITAFENCTGGICTILPDSALPDITEEVVIDATTQPGASCSTKALTVVLDGTNAGSGVSGLYYASGTEGSEVSGLVINNFSRDGIEIVSGRIWVHCNIIGLDQTGTVDQGNGNFGIRAQFGSGNSHIGVKSPTATDFSEGNVVSGNAFNGIYLFGHSGTVVAGNFVGTNKAGTGVVGNAQTGIQIQCGSGVLVGSDNDGQADEWEANVSGGNQDGIVATCGSATTLNYTIRGNYVGTDVSETIDLGNTRYGIAVENGNQDALIKSGISVGNIVTNNDVAGIAIQGPEGMDGHTISQNIINDNGGPDIDLGWDGVTANDSADADLGANKLQNHPILLYALEVGASVEIGYVVDTDTASATYPITVEFFESDGTGSLSYLGNHVFDDMDFGCSNASKPCGSKRTVATGGTITAGDRIVATATDADGNTSEFSSPIEVVGEMVTYNVKAWLEGAVGASASFMATDLKDANLLPTEQPFSDPAFDSTPLEFDSSQTAVHSPEAVDWALASLRTGTSAATEIPGTRQAVFIDRRGKVRSVNDTQLRFPGVASGSYYIVVQPRNHVGIMSSVAVSASPSGIYDFTTSNSAAFGTAAQKVVLMLDPEAQTGAAAKGSGVDVYGMYACDITGDGQITASDFNDWLVDTKNGSTGYLVTDCSLEGQVTASDFNLWLVNTKLGAESQIPN